jgi:arsenate reductase (thioredoxin)
MERKKTKVIFLCTHNAARSQMGEAFLRHYAGNHFEVYSAGFEALGINPMAREVMAEKGISMEGQESKLLDQYLGKTYFGITITVCDRAEELCPTFPGMGTRLFWPFPDPAEFEGTEEEKREQYRAVRDAIEARILEWLKSRDIEPENVL